MKCMSVCRQMGLSENVVYPFLPNGFADHYPIFKWLAIIGNINPTFSVTNPDSIARWMSCPDELSVEHPMDHHFPPLKKSHQFRGPFKKIRCSAPKKDLPWKW